MITKREAIEKTILMWDWLAEHPSADKSDALYKLFPGEKPFCQCFACDYAMDACLEDGDSCRASDSKCAHCPVWTNFDPETRQGACWADDTYDPQGTAYFDQWATASDPAASLALSREEQDEALDRQCKAAKAIANLAREALEELEDD